MYIPRYTPDRIRYTDRQKYIVKVLILLNFLMLLFYASTARAEPLTYKFDPSHTSILFKIDHLGYSKMIGEFHRYEGTLVFDKDAPEKSQLDVTIYTDSIDTDVPVLDEKLKDIKYFNSKQYPVATFRSTGIEITGEKTGVVTGDFTLLGVTRPVMLNVTFNNAGYNEYVKKQMAGFSVTGSLLRSAFNMNEGIPFVSDRVDLEIETELYAE